MKVLVAGCGFAGEAVARRFQRQGHTVWGLRRNVSRLPEGILPLAADLDDPATLESLPEGFDLIIYSASPDGSDAEAYERTYVRGVRNIIAATRRDSPGLKRFLLTSSTGVYGRTDGGWVDETTPPEPASERGEILLRAERDLLACGLDAVVIRLGGLYGPGRRRLLDNVRGGKAQCIAGLTQYSNRIHRDDVAGVLLHLAEMESPARLYLAVDDEPAERCEVLKWLAEHLGAPPPGQRLARAEDLQQSNKRCSNRRLRQSGYRLEYPTFREGYRDVLAKLEN